MNQAELAEEKNNNISVMNCYLKWDDHIEEKSYLEKMHNEIIKTPVKETLKSLHKFGHLGYLREEVYDGQSYVMKYLISEAWSEEDNNNDGNSNNRKEGYCRVSSDVLKSRLPKAIKITMEREKVEENKENKIKTTIRIGRKQQQQKREEEKYSPRVKSLKDFVQLFEQKEKEGKNPKLYVSY